MIFHERRRLGLADPEEEDGQKGGDERGERFILLALSLQVFYLSKPFLKR